MQWAGAYGHVGMGDVHWAMGSCLWTMGRGKGGMEIVERARATDLGVHDRHAMPS